MLPRCQVTVGWGYRGGQLCRGCGATLAAHELNQRRCAESLYELERFAPRLRIRQVKQRNGLLVWTPERGPCLRCAARIAPHVLDIRGRTLRGNGRAAECPPGPERKLIREPVVLKTRGLSIQHLGLRPTELRGCEPKPGCFRRGCGDRPETLELSRVAGQRECLVEHCQSIALSPPDSHACGDHQRRDSRYRRQVAQLEQCSGTSLRAIPVAAAEPRLRAQLV